MHLIYIYIYAFSLQQSSRKSNFISITKFAKNVCINNFTFIRNFRKSQLYKYNSSYLAILMLSTKIIIFRIVKVTMYKKITKSSFLKSGFLIFDIRQIKLGRLSNFLYSHIDAQCCKNFEIYFSINVTERVKVGIFGTLFFK